MLFNSGMGTTILIFFIGYVFLSLLFAVLMFAFENGKGNDKCFHISSGKTMTEMDDREVFRAAYSLSWTTLSTVGYGHVSPNLSDEHFRRTCYNVEMLTTLESLVGILYTAMTGSILYAKITRVVERAEIVFSAYACLPYAYEEFKDGQDDVENTANETREKQDFLKNAENNENVKVEQTAINSHLGDSLNTDMGLSSILKLKRKIPCPILVFRLANEVRLCV